MSPNLSAPTAWLETRPGREHSLLPFWFWNDVLQPAELIRQIADFQAHGVDGFVIHPRVGLPENQGWMSTALLDCMRVALEEARRRQMLVLLYDDGMYPSGSANGQVVAANRAHACRCLDRQPAEAPLPTGANVVAEIADRHGRIWRILDRPADAVMRGLHYLDETAVPHPTEQEPPAADVLNPQAARSFLRLVYQRYADEFADFLGDPVIGIFTDEPSLLGRCRERHVQPGTPGILAHVTRLLGRDLTPHLNALWDAEEPDAPAVRSAYHRALHLRLEETYYQPLSAWCATHGLDLCGHPGQACDLGPGRWFQVPGQDLVWRWVLPDDPSALEGVESTQGKCSSSAAAHLGRRFNSNECFGAYGHEFNEREMLGLANWCFVRGVNRLYPHAFYYSIRGPRRHERPPDVGPHSPWWPRYQRFAEACRWLSWLITDATHVCQVAVLGLSDHLPWAAAKHLFQHQIDFNYLEARHLWEDACVSANGIRLRGFHYPVLIVESPPEPPPRIWESLAPLLAAGGVCAYRADAPGTRRVDDAPALLAALRNRITPDLTLEIPEPALRVRHMLKHDRHVWLLANESYRPLAVRAQPLRPGPFRLLNPWDRTDEPWDPATPIPIAPAASVVLVEAPPEYPYQSVGE